MKNILLLPFLLLVFSCTLETSPNGDLDGLWHLQEIDSIHNGTSCNVREQRIYWAIQMHLLQLQDKNGNHIDLNCHFFHKGNTLLIKDCYENNRMEGDPLITDSTLLNPFGINRVGDIFSIKTLNSSRLKISNNLVILKFRKM